MVQRRKKKAKTKKKREGEGELWEVDSKKRGIKRVLKGEGGGRKK